jgi:CSLREA domain-containing protein
MPLARLARSRPGRGLLRLALCLSLCAALGAALRGRLVPAAGAATTFVVNSTGDGADADTADGLCDDGGGKCTLRAALTQANATPGADTINIQIGTGPQTIAPSTPLPFISEAGVTLDATTQPGYAGAPVVMLSGGGALSEGLVILGSGPSAVRGLVINGFGTGVRFSAGAGSVIEGNYIGTNAAGTSAVGNVVGVALGGTGATLGGTTAAARNVISGNGTGVLVVGDANVVRGNYVGLAADGATPLPNTGDGVLFRGALFSGLVVDVATGNRVGGTAAGEANVIAFNGGDGVSLNGDARLSMEFHHDNVVRGNSIYSNALQGIDLARAPAGVEENDAGDADDGPNGLQNHPLLDSYAPSGGGTLVSGSLDSRPDTTYSVDFYASGTCDGSGHGEGQAYLGAASVTTSASGRAQLNETLPAVPPALPFLTATATDPSGNTSEFSPCLNPSATPTVQFKRAVYEAAEAAPGGVITLTVTRTQGASSGAATVDYATSDGAAKAGLDYVAAAGTVSFAPGELTKSFDVRLVNDPTDEEAQAFNVTLSNPAGGVALGGNSTAAVNILDDDRIPSAFLDPDSSPLVTEGDAGTTPAVFTVRLNPASEKPLTVRYSTQDLTATSPQDYEAASGELTFAPGETEKSLTVNVRGDTEPEFQEAFLLRVAAPTEDGRGFNTSANCLIFDDDGRAGIHLSAARYEVPEAAGHLDVRVVRRGDTAAPASVEYRAETGLTASAQKDFTPVRGRLDFAPGETEKSFQVLVNDDAFVEGPEEMSVFIEGEGFGETGFEAARVFITSDDAQPPDASNNPVDRTDFFVRQHYHDFLGREPDPEGFAFWTGQIESCGADAECRRVMRAGVSQAFFLSIEFQRTGYLAHRVYAVGHGGSFIFNGRVYEPAPLGVLFPAMQTIRRGVYVGQPGWEQRLGENTLNFARAWVETSDFKTYVAADDVGAGAFVDRLFSLAEVTPTPAERAAAVAAFGAGGTEGRAAALLSVADSRTVYNKEYNPAFVAMQYYGYLRRSPLGEPDNGFAGYDFWLAKLDSFSSPAEDVRDDAVAAARAARAEMARAFVESAEYRARFGTP